MAVVCRKCCSFLAVLMAGIIMSTVKYVQGVKKLRMVNLVYRHGDRSPYRTFPLDETLNLWPQGLGQLTQKGMLQEFHLGEFIKQRYITKNNLLNSSYIRNQVYCRSTDVDRTIMSAQAQLNGLYPPFDKQIWRDGVKWQPIPVHVVSLKDDKILIWKDCPRYNSLLQKSFKDPKYQSMVTKYKGLVERLDPLLGFNGTLTFDRLGSIHDNFLCNKQHKFPLPHWVNDTLMNELKRIGDFQMSWLFHSPSLSSLTSGPLLGDMLNHIKSYKENQATKRAYLYSAHDTTVSGFLSVLGVFDGISPPYSSAVLLELYSSDNPGDDFSVRIFYRIGQSNEPKQLVLKGCDADCPLDQFILLTKHLIPEDRDKACGVKKGIFVKSIIYKSFLAAFVSTVIVLIIAVICICCCWCRYRRAVNRAARIKFDDGLLKDASLLNNQDYDSE